jgi:hypothetical protein
VKSAKPPAEVVVAPPPADPEAVHVISPPPEPVVVEPEPEPFVEMPVVEAIPEPPPPTVAAPVMEEPVVTEAPPSPARSRPQWRPPLPRALRLFLNAPRFRHPQAAWCRRRFAYESRTRGPDRRRRLHRVGRCSCGRRCRRHLPRRRCPLAI